jgi:hypothetical protein
MNTMICNQQVHGSSPCAGSLSINDLRKTLKRKNGPLYTAIVYCGQNRLRKGTQGTASADLILGKVAALCKKLA